MKVLHFGAGNIGRGFIAPILFKDESIEHIKFTDTNYEVIEKINYYKKFNVIELDKEKNIIKIENKISGIVSDSLINNLNNYSIDICTTSIGIMNLKFIENSIIEIIKQNENENKILIIMCCENGERVSSFLKNKIFEIYNFNENLIFFVDVMVDRIVPNQISNQLDIEVEKYYSWIVDQQQWPNTIRKISSLVYTKNMEAEICKKIWLLNGSHASLSWAAYKLNKFSVSVTNECLKLKELKQFLVDYLNEVGNIFVQYFNYDINEVNKFIGQIIMRFENIYIKDDLERVGRNLFSKLQLNERILKPLFIGYNLKLKTSTIRKSILNALYYTNENDSDGKKISLMHKNKKTNEEILKEIVENISNSKIDFILKSNSNKRGN